MNVIHLERLLYLVVNSSVVNDFIIALAPVVHLPNLKRKHTLVFQADSDESRSIIGLTTIEPKDNLVATAKPVVQRPKVVPVFRTVDTVIGGNNLIEPEATRE